MKILIISNLYPPRVQGGAEIIAETMAHGFMHHGHEVVVATTGEFHSFRSLRPELRMQDGIRVYSWYPLNIYDYRTGSERNWVLRALWHLLDIFNVHSAAQMTAVLENEKPDLVITHNLMGMGFLIPRCISRSGYRHVHVLHDVQLYNPSGIIRVGQENSLQQRAYTLLGYPALMRYLFRSCRTLVSPSRFLINFYERYGFFKTATTHVIPNPIDLRPLPRVTAKDARLRFLYVGQLSEAKGAVGLVDTFLQIDGARASLTLIGDGADEKYIRLQAGSASNITVLERVPRTRLAEFFADSDVVVVPSLCYDTFPTVIAEALRCGIPVIASDSGGATEIVHERGNGWIVPAGDWNQLVRRIKLLIADPERLREASRHAQASVAHLTSERYTDAFLRAVRS